MEFTLHLDPRDVATAQRNIYAQIPPEFRELYLSHLTPVLAAMVTQQTVMPAAA